MFRKMIQDSIGGFGLLCLLVAALPTLAGCSYIRECSNGRGKENQAIFQCTRKLPDNYCLVPNVRCDIEVEECYCRNEIDPRSGERLCPCTTRPYKEPA
jgi:hypothetical protein